MLLQFGAVERENFLSMVFWPRAKIDRVRLILLILHLCLVLEIILQITIPLRPILEIIPTPGWTMFVFIMSFYPT